VFSERLGCGHILRLAIPTPSGNDNLDNSFPALGPKFEAGELHFMRYSAFIIRFRLSQMTPRIYSLLGRFFAGASLLLAFSSPAAEPSYDLVIRHGKIIDGTGNPWFYGDVAVAGDRIASAGVVEGSGKREIDARGFVVAPGFIDIHSHSDWLLLEDGNAQSKIRQGVTTEVLGEGSSAGPFKGKLVPRPVSVQNQAAQIRTLAEYFSAAERSGISVNIASYVGEGNIWQCVMGDSFERPGPAELQRMKELVAEAMKDGACGLSTALMMPPGSLATTDDLVELCKVVREHGGRFQPHPDEGLGVFDW
jgi:N-acyl-D-aspartate/D-glutamate deacylase